MRAIQVTEYGGTDVFEHTDVDVPAPDRGEVRIDVAAAGVNFADVEKRRGNYPDSPTPPYVPGMEVAGRVDAPGAGVDREVGERVVAILDRGGYAEAAIAPEDSVFDVPETLDFVDAAGVPVQFLTAHNALHEWGGLTQGDRVLVHAAAGGVGSAAVQLASHAGAEVFGTASQPRKLDLAADLGADHVIDYSDASVADEIASITDGDGVDLVLDGVGGDAFYEGLDALADFGQIVVYGMASGDIPTVSSPRLIFENRSVVGYHLGHALDHRPERVYAAVSEIDALLDRGAVDVVVGETFALEDVAAAHELLESRESTGKVVLEV